MPRDSTRPRLKGFAPVIDAGVERLILGSFPSEASLDASQYYAHPRNQFWRLLGELLDEPLGEMPYANRLRVVRSHRLGIWDVLGACDRTGSADTAIRNAQANRFARLHRLAPNLVDVAFNGRAAGRFQPTFAAGGFRTTVLPSSSPAHASLSYDQKLAAWRAWWNSWPRHSSPRPHIR